VAEKMDPPKRPSNVEAVGLAEFDQIVAMLVSQPFRQTKPISGVVGIPFTQLVAPGSR